MSLVRFLLLLQLQLLALLELNLNQYGRMGIRAYIVHLLYLIKLLLAVAPS